MGEQARGNLALPAGPVLVPAARELNALLGVGIAIATITAATGLIEMSSTTSTLALMLGLAVAIDYALFIVSRYRTELREGRPGEEAAGRAAGTAGSAVVFAGLTVVIALAGLAVVNVPILTEMGLAATFGAVVAVFQWGWLADLWLGRVLPDVDVEGEKLRDRLGDAPADERELDRART